MLLLRASLSAALTTAKRESPPGRYRGLQPTFGIELGKTVQPGLGRHRLALAVNGYLASEQLAALCVRAWVGG